MDSSLVIGLVVACLFLIWLKENYKEKGKAEKPLNENQIYYSQKDLMTLTEKKFYAAIRSVLSDSYVLLPQVNLATIIQKNGDFKYQNELYRNIDFGVFDQNFNLVVLVEINDASHNDSSRAKRDLKVKSILEEAKIPLITFHTKYGINREYISKRLSEYITEIKK